MKYCISCSLFCYKLSNTPNYATKSSITLSLFLSLSVSVSWETGSWKTLFEKEKQAGVPGSRKRRTAIAFLVAAPLTSALQTVKISKRSVERITDTKWIQITDKNFLAVHTFCVKISNIVDKRRRGKHLRMHLKDFLRPVSLSHQRTHKR